MLLFVALALAVSIPLVVVPVRLEQSFQLGANDKISLSLDFGLFAGKKGTSLKLVTVF